jgi:uncharacterized membrane protein HdeD (DUF308 family)
MLTKLKQVKWGYLLFAVLLFCVGLLFVAKNEALSYVAITFGILLAVFAVFNIGSAIDLSRFINLPEWAAAELPEAVHTFGCVQAHPYHPWNRR